MKKLLLLALAALWSAAPPTFAAPATTSPTANPKPQKIVVHLSDSSSNNALHSAMMAIGLATGLEKKGAQVTLMLDSSAPNFAKKSWSNKALTGAMPGQKARTLGTTMSEFLQAGGRVVLCPHCSMTCGVVAGNVLPGVRIGADGQLVNLVFEADKILDY